MGIEVLGNKGKLSKNVPLEAAWIAVLELVDSTTQLITSEAYYPQHVIWRIEDMTRLLNQVKKYMVEAKEL